MDEGAHQVTVLPELLYSIEAWPLSDRGRVYVVSFIAREVSEVHHRDGRVSFEYTEEVPSGGRAPTSDLPTAEWHLRGDVKWDGCCNYQYNDAGCLLHICGPADIEREAALLRAVYRIAHEMMPETRDFEP